MLNLSRSADLQGVATREGFGRLVNVPPGAVAHGKGTDIEEDLPTLYAITAYMTPGLIVELGTRQGVSTRTLAAAAGLYGGLVVAVDPEDCRRYLEGVSCLYVRMFGEDLFRSIESYSLNPVDMLMIDTDPHTYDQTMMWLDTWVKQRLRSGGCAAFHDIVPARSEIRVGDAVRDWIQGRSGWLWREYRPLNTGPVFNGGLGLLWRT